RGDLIAQLQVVDGDAIHLLEVHVVAGGVEQVGIVSPAEEAGGAALADDVRFLQRPGQHHERQHRHARRLEAGDVRADVGEVLGAGGFELSGGADLVGRVAGQHLVYGRRVVD